MADLAGRGEVIAQRIDQRTEATSTGRRLHQHDGSLRFGLVFMIICAAARTGRWYRWVS